MEAVTLVYMPKNCMYMPEPSSGDHYTLLPLTGGKDISIGVLSAFAAAKMTVASKHGSGNMGVHLKLPPSFGPKPDSDNLITETALSHGPIWRNTEFVLRDGNNRVVLVNGEPMATESTIKVARVDQYTPINCRAWTNVAYEPKFANDVFTFQETVAEMQQCLDRTKTATAQNHLSLWSLMSFTRKLWPQPELLCLHQSPVTLRWLLWQGWSLLILKSIRPT